MTTVVAGLDFGLAKQAVAKQFEKMQKHPMFRMGAITHELWALYLGSFPPGTNPMFRERTEHDCACCRHFIRDIGNAVAVINGKIVTVWDESTGDPAYDAVFRELASFVRKHSITDVFMHCDRTAGTDKNFERREGEPVRTWNHFHVNVAQTFVAKRSDIPSILSVKRSTHDVLERGLRELTMDALDQFLELTAQGSLYRGEEFKGMVQKFRSLKVQYDLADERQKTLFTWIVSQQESQALCHIRNSAVGTLLVNLSEGMDLEAAVKAYESVVAPTNYKRPTALVTKAMIEKAKKAIDELGLTPALNRRYAVLADISVNNVLFADRGARKVMHDAFDELVAAAPAKKAKTFDDVAEVPVEQFIRDILPNIESMEVLVENRHANNFVSLVAPADPTAGLLFKWPNAFSWSYAGEVTDSIKERVKAAGGSVTGDLCCRLAWHNYDDLDFHMTEPGGGHIYFATRGRASPCGGKLDVDMNAGHGHTRTPVENIFYARQSTMRTGTYVLSVHNYNNRDKTDPGFEVEIDLMGTIHSFVSDRSPKQNERMEIARFEYSVNDRLQLVTPLESKRVSKQAWGIATEQFQRVNVMMLSPNHWDDANVGNKHYFFMLDGCANDGTVRGFYNEFLTPALDAHRKVFEIVGSKMKPASASEQLSGLGFSSTQRNTLLCRVKGSFTRTIKIVF